MDKFELTAVLHALSDPTRLAIVRTLYADREGRACGTFPVEVAASTLSHHFGVLRAAGLISQEDRGNQRWTTLRLAEMDQRFPNVLPSLLAVK